MRGGPGVGARLRPALRSAAAAVAVADRRGRHHRAHFRGGGRVPSQGRFQRRLPANGAARGSAGAYGRRAEAARRGDLPADHRRRPLRGPGCLSQPDHHHGVDHLVGRPRIRLRAGGRSLGARQPAAHDLRLGREAVRGDDRRAAAVARPRLSPRAWRVACGAAVLPLRVGGARLAGQRRAGFPRARGARLCALHLGGHAPVRPRHVAREGRSLQRRLRRARALRAAARRGRPPGAAPARRRPPGARAGLGLLSRFRAADALHRHVRRIHRDTAHAAHRYRDPALAAARPVAVRAVGVGVERNAGGCTRRRSPSFRSSSLPPSGRRAGRWCASPAARCRRGKRPARLS